MDQPPHHCISCNDEFRLQCTAWVQHGLVESLQALRCKRAVPRPTCGCWCLVHDRLLILRHFCAVLIICGTLMVQDQGWHARIMVGMTHIVCLGMSLANPQASKEFKHLTIVAGFGHVVLRCPRLQP